MKIQLQRMGMDPIAKMDISRDLKRVYITVKGRRPDRDSENPRARAWFESPGNRWVRLTPSQARKVAFRLIQAAAEVDRELDKYGFWPDS